MPLVGGSMEFRDSGFAKSQLRPRTANSLAMRRRSLGLPSTRKPLSVSLERRGSLSSNLPNINKDAKEDSRGMSTGLAPIYLCNSAGGKPPSGRLDGSGKGRHYSMRRSKRPLTASPVRDERKKFLTSASTEFLHVEQKGEPQRPSPSSTLMFGSMEGGHRKNLSPHAFHSYSSEGNAKTIAMNPATSESRALPAFDRGAEAHGASTSEVANELATLASGQRPGTAPKSMATPSIGLGIGGVNEPNFRGVRKASLKEQNSHLQAEIRRLQEGFVSHLRGPKRFTSGGGFRTAANKSQDGGKGSSLHLRNAVKKIKEDNRELERTVQSLTVELREARDEIARAASYFTKEKQDHRKRENILLKEIEGKALVESRALECEAACRELKRELDAVNRAKTEITQTCDATQKELEILKEKWADEQSRVSTTTTSATQTLQIPVHDEDCLSKEGVIALKDQISQLQDNKHTLEGLLQEAQSRQEDSERASQRHRRDSEAASLEAQHSRQSLLEAMQQTKSMEEKLRELETRHGAAAEKLNLQLVELTAELEKKSAAVRARDETIAEVQEALAELRGALEKAKVEEQMRRRGDQSKVQELQQEVLDLRSTQDEARKLLQGKENQKRKLAAEIKVVRERLCKAIEDAQVSKDQSARELGDALRETEEQKLRVEALVREVAALKQFHDEALQEAVRNATEEAKKKAMEMTLQSMVRLCVVAPTVNVHLNIPGEEVEDAMEECKAPLPRERIKRIIERNILPLFTRIFIQDQEGLAPNGKQLDSWLEQMLTEMQGSIESHLADVFGEDSGK